MSSDNEDDLLQQRITESLMAWITSIMKEQIDQARREGHKAGWDNFQKSIGWAEDGMMRIDATEESAYEKYLKSKGEG